MLFFFFKQKTAYEMRISDWSSDVCSSDLTDAEGRYSIQASQGETMVFSIIGYTRQTVTVGSSAMINITMVENASELGEVVVTALGIRRERKSLGYAFQDIKGEDLVVRREDRKSVGQGTSGSERVRLGGRGNKK